MNILGLHDSHNASACLMTDGKIIHVLQEERPTAEKNKSGLPIQASNEILKKAGLSMSDIDIVSVCSNYAPYNKSRNEWLGYYHSFLSKKLVNLNLIKNRLKNIPIVAAPFEKKNRQMRLTEVVNTLGVDSRRINFIEHHSLHAATAYFGYGNFNEDILVLTNDGAGDRLCATVNIGSRGKINRIAEVHENHSIGILYAVFTFLTGMMPLEHEYKLMGMAPYADKNKARVVADQFRSMFQFSPDGVIWKFTKGYSIFAAIPYFKDFIFLKRFDHLMAGLQLFCEEFLAKWVSACIKKTGIKKVALSGGVFMNVKANQRIAEMAEIDELFIFPSCGDESNAIGACYTILAEKSNYKQLEKLRDIYFGISYSNDEIKSAFESYAFTKQYTCVYYGDIEKELARLIAAGHVVGRFQGREEFGARSLGNRAIIADAGKPGIVREINEMIKNRDFWMPFASSILDTDFDNYIVANPKASPYYMMMTYDTKPAASAIAGGIHPYDKTVRPQMVTKQHNADYWRLINEFKNITGVGAVLNTSLNLHGLPLVHKPEDAFYVLENSSLKYLGIENYLIKKCH